MELIWQICLSSWNPGYIKDDPPVKTTEAETRSSFKAILHTVNTSIPGSILFECTSLLSLKHLPSHVSGMCRSSHNNTWKSTINDYITKDK